MLNLIPYCIILRNSADLDNCLSFILRYTHANRVPRVIDLICELVLIFYVGYYQYQTIPSIINCFRPILLKFLFTFNTYVVSVGWAGQIFKWSKI